MVLLFESLKGNWDLHANKNTYQGKEYYSSFYLKHQESNETNRIPDRVAFIMLEMLFLLQNIGKLPVDPIIKREWEEKEKPKYTKKVKKK